MSKSNPPEILKFQENLNLNLNLPESLQKAKGKPKYLFPLKLGIVSPKKQSNFSNNAISFLDSFKKKAVVSPVIRQDLQKLKDKLADVIKSKKRKSNILNSTTIKKKITEIQTPNYLWIIFFVKKFISILKANVLLKKLAKMKNYHYNLIGDKTHYNADLNILYKIMHNNNPLFQNEIINKSAVQLVKEKIIKFKNLMLVLFMKFEVFQPDKPIISVWNFTMLFFVFINAFYIPMKIGFAIEEYDINVIFFVIFGQVPVWIFIFDILISLNTAYYSKGVFISDRYKIIKNYIKNFFLLDLVSIGPFLIGYFSNIGYVEMLFLLRILKLNASIKKLEEFLQLRDLYGARFQLIKLMGLIFYIAHVSCCGWQFLASFEISRGENHTWLDSLGIREASWEIRYVNSLYYSIVTMVTVGYGDITPQNTVEKIYLIFYIGVACGVFAYSVNEVGTILKEMYKSENDFKVQFLTMNAYMKSRGLNKALQLKVQKYLEYMHEENKFGYKNGDLLLSSLSSKLKQEVLIDIYGKILKDYVVFNNNFSTNFLKKIALKIREMTFAPDDIIIEENDRYDKSLYFILKGEVECFQGLKNENSKKQNSLKFLKKGEHFGSNSFFTNEIREISIKSVNITHIACLHQQDFLDTIKEFPEDFEKYCMLVDMIKVYNKYSELNVKCDSCDSLDHSVLKCDLINYKPFPTKIIQQYQKNSFQIRKQFTRLRKRKFQVLKNKTHLERNFTKFRDFQENVLAEYHFKYLENESELDYSSSDSESLIYLDNLNGDLEIKENLENQPKIDFKPPFILIQEPIDDFTYVNKKNTVKEDHKRKTIEEKRISVDGMFLSKRIMNNSSSNDPPNFNSKPIEKHSLKEKMLKVNEKEEMNNSLILGNDNPFSKSLVRLKKKSFMSISNYNLDNSEQNLFEEIDIRQEMDILKTYKFYFPNNNCEIILEKMERKKLEDTQKLLCLSPRKRKFKRVSKNNTDMFHHNKRFKKIHPFEIKDKKFLANLIKNNNH